MSLQNKYCIYLRSNERLACQLQNADRFVSLVTDKEGDVRREYASHENQLFDMLEHWTYNDDYLFECTYVARILNKTRFDAWAENVLQK